MDSNTVQQPPTQPTTATNQECEIHGAHPYHAPTFVCHGELAELVQQNPGGGADGSVFPDCTRS